MCFVITFIGYKTIPIIDEYDKKNNEQAQMILKQTEIQKNIVVKIKEKMNGLFGKVDNQNVIIINFNEMIQNQAATFEEISATIEELFSSAEKISDSATLQLTESNKLKTIVDAFKELKLKTKNSLDLTLTTIEETVKDVNLGKEKIEEVEKTIADLNVQSESISATVSIITDIADRINLLSLNASIEAARAGDYGRGFAVVADEIGKLAFQTSESIQDIGEILSQNRVSTTAGVDVIRSTAEVIKRMIFNMEESSKNIKFLKESIFEEEERLKHINSQLEINIRFSNEMRSGTEEQKIALEDTASGVQDVNNIVTVMSENISQISSVSKEIVSDAKELLLIAENKEN